MKKPKYLELLDNAQIKDGIPIVIDEKLIKNENGLEQVKENYPNNIVVALNIPVAKNIRSVGALNYTFNFDIELKPLMEFTAKNGNKVYLIFRKDNYLNLVFAIPEKPSTNMIGQLYLFNPICALPIGEEDKQGWEKLLKDTIFDKNKPCTVYFCFEELFSKYYRIKDYFDTSEIKWQNKWLFEYNPYLETELLPYPKYVIENEKVSQNKNTVLVKYYFRYYKDKDTYEDLATYDEII